MNVIIHQFEVIDLSLGKVLHWLDIRRDREQESTQRRGETRQCMILTTQRDAVKSESYDELSPRVGIEHCRQSERHLEDGCSTLTTREDVGFGDA